MKAADGKMYKTQATADDEDERERGFRNLAGCWANDEGDDDMEAIIREGREGRRGSCSVRTKENSNIWDEEL